MKYLKVLLLLILAVTVLTGCKNDAPDADAEPTVSPDIIDEAPVTLEPFVFSRDDFPRMDGSPATVPLAQALAAIMLGQSREDVAELAMFTETTRAYRNLANGVCDILIAGEPYPSVLDEISQQDFRFNMTPIAVDALVFIVSASNPVNNLTSAQAKAIYSGSIDNWQHVGGNDSALLAFQRNEESLSQVLADKLLMDWDKMADAPMQAIPGFYENDGDTVPTAIRGFDSSEGAIGYTMYYYAVNMGMADGFKILSIDGVMPTPDTISGGDYPFTNPYYAVINRDLPEDDNTRILYNWLLSDDGQAFISSQGYISMQDTDGLDNTETVTMRWGVVTDDSNLTPYNSPRSQSAKLYNAALTELVAFDGYGPLLPYSTAVTMNDGSIHPINYGFTAMLSGTVVTDPIFDFIDRAFYFGDNGNTALPAYRLYIDIPDEDSEFGYSSILAACAEDGSWITPFAYVNIIFREDVIFCMKSDDTFEVDVYDYSGNLLYKILDLEWLGSIADDVWQMMYSVRGGCGWVRLDDGYYALFDVLTGEIIKTNFVQVSAFSDGLAAVSPTGTEGHWAYVNRQLEIVIEPLYIMGSDFINGRAIVETSDLNGNVQHIIDKQGNVLFSAQAGYFLNSLNLTNDNYGYSATSMQSAEYIPTKYYTNDFDEIAIPSDALPLNPESVVYQLGYGWFICMTENGTWIFNPDEVHTLPASVQHIANFSGDHIVYVEYDDAGFSHTGVMTIDGTVIIPPVAGAAIVPVVSDGSLTGFAVTVGNTASGFIENSYSRAEYQYVDLSSQLIKHDLGTLSYDEVSGFLYAQGSDYCAWITVDGETFISIPSMAYTVD